VKIAIITDQFPAVSETWVTREVDDLQAKGHEVTVIARQINESDNALHAKQLQIALSPNPVIAFLQGMWAWCTAGPAYRQVIDDATFFSFRERLKRLYRYARIKKLTFDKVHVHFGSVAALYDFIPATHGCPYVVTFHGYDLRRGERDRGARYQHLFKHADTIVAISEYTRNKLLAFDCPAEKIQRENLGIDTALFYPPAEKRDHTSFRILTVARLVEEKNLTLAIQAVAQVIKNNPDSSITYKIIGEGPERLLLEECAADCGVEIAMPGAMPSAQVADEMRAATVFLLSSQQEVAPVVISEALATGLPVIATDVGAVAEIIQQDKNSLLVPPDNIPAMQTALETLLDK